MKHHHQIQNKPMNIIKKIKSIHEHILVFREERKRAILNLSDCPDEFNSYYGQGYGQKSGCTVSVNLIAPHSRAEEGMLIMQTGHPNQWTVVFDGVVIARFLSKTNAIAGIKRTLRAE